MCVHMVHTWCTPCVHQMVHTMCVPCDMVHTWCTCVLTIITASPVPLAMVLVGHRRALRTPAVVMVMMPCVCDPASVCFSQHAGSHGAIRPSRRYQTMVYFTMIKDVLHIMFTLVRKRKDSSF